MIEEIRSFRRAELPFKDYGDGPGAAAIARLVGPGDSATMGAYLARFDRRSVAWAVQYDELIVCIEGEFRLRSGEDSHTLFPGDVLWIPNGTSLRYEGVACLVFIAIAPVDWRSRIEAVAV